MTMTDEKMDELANYQIDAMDSSDVVEMITDSLKEYWLSYPEDFAEQWEEYQAMVGEKYEDGD